MAAYVKHGDQIVLALSKGEAAALLDVVLAGEEELARRPAPNNSVSAARNRAVRALETACEASSRSGAAIQ